MVERWRRTGAIAEPLRPIVRSRSELLEAMLEDLGGAGQVSAMRRAVLEGQWLYAQVLADVLFRRVVCEEEWGSLERIATLLNTARAALVAVGLDRVASDPEDLGAYIERLGREAAAPDLTHGRGCACARQ